MSDTGQFNMSRRGVLAASLMAPIIVPSLGGLAGSLALSALHDPFIAKASAWIAQRQHVDAMTYRWQGFESQMFRRARALGIEIDAARGRRFPEVQAMRMLDRRIDTAYCELRGLEKEASLMRALSLEGALAKIELGLRVQGRYSWQDHALELAEGGIMDLREMTPQKGQLRSRE